MSEDLTETIPQNDGGKLTLILKTVLSTSVRLDSIDSRLGFVEQKVGRLQEGQQHLEEGYRSLYEGQRRLEGRVEEGVRRLEEGQERLRFEFAALKRSVDHRFLILSGQVQASYSSLDERITRLELKANPPNSQT
jgi:hypothetical protein